MNDTRPVEIVCSACGADTLLLRKPKYEGFTRVGESLTCASCGHEYAGEADVLFKNRPVVKVFSDSDRSRKVEVFSDGEAQGLCRHCASYVVNPFLQWCSLHKKEVEATDSCPRFQPRPPPKEEEKKPAPKPVL